MVALLHFCCWFSNEKQSRPFRQDKQVNNLLLYIADVVVHSQDSVQKTHFYCQQSLQLCILFWCANLFFKQKLFHRITKRFEFQVAIKMRQKESNKKIAKNYSSFSPHLYFSKYCRLERNRTNYRFIKISKYLLKNINGRIIFFGID